MQKAEPILSQISDSGLKRSGGFITEEFHRNLRGTKAAKIYAEMRANDPIVGAFIFGLDMLIRQVQWKVQPADQDPLALDAARFLESCMHDMSHSWNDTISEVLSMLPYGWAFHEIVYKRRRGTSDDPTLNSKFDDGLIGWRKIPLVAQESLASWDFDDSDGSVRGMIQGGDTFWNNRFIPIEKALLFRTSVHKNNPEGRSVLRNAYRPWYFKKRIEEIEAIGIERDLAGLPIMYVDPALLDPNAPAAYQSLLSEYKKVVVNVRRDEQEGLILPAQYDNEGRKLFDFQLLSASGGRQFDTDRVIGRKNQEIAMTALADFILLGHERVGSFALSSDKTALFSVAIGAWLDSIQEIFNMHAVPRLFRLNAKFDRLTQYPKIVHGDIESPDLGSLGNFIQVLTAAGVPLFPDDELENHLRRIAGLPMKPKDEETLSAQQDAMQEAKTSTQSQMIGKPKGEVPQERTPETKSPAAGMR